MAPRAQFASVRRLLVLLAMLSVCFAGLLLVQQAIAAGSERYEYDGLGRLTRVINGAGQGVDYHYDPAGNITAVVSAGKVAPPTVTKVEPASVRKASLSRVSLTGTELGNASVTSATEGIDISRVSRAAQVLSLDLEVSASTPVGPATLVVATAAGSTNVQITIRPALPTADVSPLPIAVAPGSGVSAYDVVLSNADDQAHSFSLAVLRPDVATVSPANLTLAPGQTSAKFTVRGVAGGNTELRLSSTTLNAVQVPVFVTANPEGINSARAISVGVEFAKPVEPARGFASTVVAPLVGVSFGGSAWLDTQPRFVAQGATQTLVVTGRGLPVGLSAQIVPAEGLVIGSPVLAGDGSQAQWTVTASDTAATGLRQLVLTGNGQRMSPIAAGADQIDVVVPQPEVLSVFPIVFEPGSGGLPLLIRGRNLQDVTGIELRGGGMTAASTWAVNSEGTALSTRVDVSFMADPGPRLVVLKSPSGNSATVASSANTVVVTDGLETLDAFNDLASPSVGVVLAQADVPVDRRQDAAASAVGVSFGPILTGLEPASIAWGDTKVLTLTGAHLQDVDVVAFEPATGLTVTAIRAAADGNSVQVTVVADASAPLGLRRVLVKAGQQAIGFAPLFQPGLLVTPPLPVMASIEPNTAWVGETFALRLRGQNFLNASAVRITPAADVSIGPVAVNADGTQAEARVSIAAKAASGPRVVSLVVAAGETSTTAGPTNVLTIGTAPVTYTDFTAALVGVRFGDPVVEQPKPSNVLAVSPIVGVQVGDISPVGTPGTAWALAVGVEFGVLTQTKSVEQLHATMPAGVLVGPGVSGVVPGGLVRGQTAELRISGHELPQGARVTVEPASCLVFNGAAVLANGGALLTQNVSVPLEAVAPACRLRVLDEQGGAVPSAGAEAGLIRVVGSLPEVVSIEPILAKQGSSGTLLIRGEGLSAVSQVLMEPAQGLDLSPSITVNSAGTELTVPFSVRTDTALGARVVRVINAAGSSSTLASPANTFTVFPKE